MVSFFRFSMGLCVGYWICAAIVFFWPESTSLYFDGWAAGQEFCKATDETPINQPLPLAEQLRRKK